MSEYDNSKTPTGDSTRPTAADSERRELEVKFETDAWGLERVRNSVILSSAIGTGRKRSLKTVYYDTGACDLHRHRTVLRMRKIGRRYVMGLKWPTADSDGHFARGEIEVALPTAAPDIDRFDDATAGKLRNLIGESPLEPKCATEFKRALHLVEAGSSRVEVAIDDGFVVAGERRTPLREVELELKTGDPAPLYDLAIRLTREVPLRLGVLSKGERGFLLLTGSAPNSSKAIDPVLSATATLDEAIGAVIGGTLAHFVQNLPAFDGDDEIEAVHQLRVALRRLRSAIAQFARVVPCPELTGLRTAAKVLANALGSARGWDVFREFVEDGPLKHHRRDGAFDGLLAAADERRAQAYDTARQSMQGSTTTIFVLELQAFLSRRGWRNGLPGDALAKLVEPAKVFAADEIERLRQQVLKRGKNLLDAPPPQRHSVRIALKKLRYALDFFGPLLDASGMRGYVRQISKLQDVLGEYNDAVAIVDLARAAREGAGDGAAHAGGIVEGWFSRATVSGDDELGQRWKRFRRTPSPV